MLEEQIHYGALPAPQARAKEQIGVVLPQMLVHKRALLQLEPGEVELPGHLVRQQGPEKLPAPFRVAEKGFKEGVVRIGNVLVHGCFFLSG
jgi:hypothetical protein